MRNFWCELENNQLDILRYGHMDFIKIGYITMFLVDGIRINIKNSYIMGEAYITNYLEEFQTVERNIFRTIL